MIPEVFQIIGEKVWSGVLMGDMNNGGVRHVLGLKAFESALENTPAWERQYGISVLLPGDFNDDGFFDGDDPIGFNESMSEIIASWCRSRRRGFCWRWGVRRGLVESVVGGHGNWLPWFRRNKR